MRIVQTLGYLDSSFLLCSLLASCFTLCMQDRVLRTGKSLWDTSLTSKTEAGREQVMTIPQEQVGNGQDPGSR